MYRIVRGEAHQQERSASEHAHAQSTKLLRDLTNAPQGNFDAQSHEEHLRYLEEVVFESLRTHHAELSPKTPVAKERHYQTLQQNLLALAHYACGVDYDEIPSVPHNAPAASEHVGTIVSSLKESPLYSPAYFSARYRDRHPGFKRSAYSGLLGVIRLTGPVTPTEITHGNSAEPIRSRAQRQPRTNTNGSSTVDSVGQYFKEISRTPLLNAEQEVALAKRIEGGLVAKQALVLHERQLTAHEIEELEWLIDNGQQAFNHFYEANLRLVVSIARKYRLMDGMTLGDVIQEGNIGLRRAVEKFDHTSGNKFSTYATWWIKQAINRGINEQATLIRRPANVNVEINKMRRIRAQISADGHEATHELIAEKMSITVDRAKQLADWSKQVISLDQPVSSGKDNKRFNEGTTLLDLVAGSYDDVQNTVEHSAAHDKLFASLDTLDERSASAINMYYGLHGREVHTYADIGVALGLTGERVRQIINKALEQLRNNMPGNFEEYVV